MTGDVTTLLNRADDGDPEAADELFAAVYAELRAIAGRLMARERPGHTLSPTALVSEAYLRLTSPDGATFENRRHFFGAAANAMRRILVDHARRVAVGRKARAAIAHEPAPDEPDPADAAIGPKPEHVLMVDTALDALSAEHPRVAEVVRLRFFAGLDIGATADVLDISRATVIRDWRFGRSWLYANLDEGKDTDA